ncbi:MAG TPA: hypothetical protein DCX65_06990 [Spirochaetaceae bacterium]|nr:hypothetical protein [Spirochaetaceae bacterium]
MAGTAEAWLDADGELVVVERGDKDSRPEGGTKQTLTLGLAFPDNFLLDTLSGREATVRLLVNNNTPVELRQAMRSLVREMVFMISGHPLPVTEPVAETVILGVDRMGAQISMRERMRPMLIFFVLMMESLSLASLISVEIMHCTVLAIAATPAKPSHILLAKTLFGMLLAFVQVVVILALIDAFAVGNLPILLVAAALGGLMFSGVAMFVGSMGKDFMGTLTWMMLFILPLAIPSVASLFPGSAPLWVRLVPSYSLIDILNRAANYGAGWLELAPAFGVLVVWLLGLFGLGWLTLSRKVARL